MGEEEEEEKAIMPLPVPALLLTVSSRVSGHRVMLSAFQHDNDSNGNRNGNSNSNSNSSSNSNSNSSSRLRVVGYEPATGSEHELLLDQSQWAVLGVKSSLETMTSEDKEELSRMVFEHLKIEEGSMMFPASGSGGGGADNEDEEEEMPVI